MKHLENLVGVLFVILLCVACGIVCAGILRLMVTFISQVLAVQGP